MRVKEIRLNKGYYQRDIAFILGISQNTYSDKETGKTNFTVSEIKMLRKMFNVTYEELLGEY